MKKLTLISGILLFAVLLQTSCSSKEEKAENHDVIKVDRALGAFDEIEINGVFNVYIKQGPKEGIVIETEKSALGSIITEVKDKKLVIGMKDDYNFDHIREKDLYITVKQISKIINNGVGNMEATEGLVLKELSLECKGVGNTNLSLTLNKFTAEIDGVGNITLKGTSKEAKINKEGVGNLFAFDFEVEKLDLDFSGVGNNEVNATKELSIEASAVGNLSYKGNAAILKMEHSGVGKIKKY